MKTRFRITTGRVALAIVLMPVLYVLNLGPLVYCTYRFGLPGEVLSTIARPVVWVAKGTAFEEPLGQYIYWWGERAGLENVF